MRLHTPCAWLGALAAVAAMATLDATAQLTARQPSADTKSTDDSEFVQEAIRGNLAEIQMGELAKERAQSKDVRDYGRMLVDDHSKANQNAIAAAKSMNIAAPTEPSEQQKKEHDAIANMSGSQFDSLFMSHMIQDHRHDIAQYKAQAQSGRSSKATDYAKSTLPTLNSHFSKAQAVQMKLADQSSSRSSLSGDEEGSHSTDRTQPFGSGSNQGHSGVDDASSNGERAPQ